MEAVHPAPDEAFVCVGDADGVVGAAFDVGHFSVGSAREFGYKGGMVNVALFAVSDLFADAGLAVAIQAPRVDFSIFCDGERVVGAAADCYDLFAFESELLRCQAVEFHALDDATTKLILLTAAPGIDGAGGGKSEDMIATAG